MKSNVNVQNLTLVISAITLVLVIVLLNRNTIENFNQGSGVPGSGGYASGVSSGGSQAIATGSGGYPLGVSSGGSQAIATGSGGYTAGMGSQTGPFEDGMTGSGAGVVARAIDDPNIDNVSVEHSTNNAVFGIAPPSL